MQADVWIRDLRVAARVLRRSPLTTTAAILSLAIGTGVNVSTFSVVSAALFRHLPYPRAGDLYLVRHADQSGVGSLRWSYDRVAQLRGVNTAMASIAGFTETKLPVTGDSVEQVSVEAVTPGYFSTLGISPLLGRWPDGTAGSAGDRTVIVSNRFWSTRLGANPNVLGTSLSINGVPLTIGGVARADFRGQSGSDDLWVPAELLPQLTGHVDELSSRSWIFSAVARARPGTSRGAVEAELSALGPRLDALTGGGAAVTVRLRLVPVPLADARVDPRLRDEFLLLLGFAVCVLIAAATNVGGLLIARGHARAREIAVRAAVGARARDILRLLLAESLELTLAGGALGVLVGQWTASLLWAIRPVTSAGTWYVQLTGIAAPRLDLRVWAFTLASLVLVCGICGVVPFTSVWFGRVGAAWRSTAAPVSSGLAIGRRGRAGAQSALTAVQVAAAFVLLLVSTLFAASLARLLRADPGFRPAQLATVRVALSARRYDARRAAFFYGDLLTRVRAIPGVAAATIDIALPMSGRGQSTAATVRSSGPIGDGGPGTPIDFHAVAPGHFAAMGMPILRGRAFGDDDVAGGRRVVVVNRSAAAKYWPNANPVGQRIASLLYLGMTGDWAEAEVVGVVSDVKYGAPAAPAEPAVYVPYEQAPAADAYLIVRSRRTLDDLAHAIRAEARAIDPAIPVSDAQTVDAQLREATSGSRFATLLLWVYAAAALSLVSVGLYAMVAFGVSRRRKEIAVRIAVGATPRQIVALVARAAMEVVGAGLVAGAAVAVLVARLVAHGLYGVDLLSPTSYAVAAGLLLVVAGVASIIPARRAASIDPRGVLASET